MGLRFNRRIRLLPGLRLNVGKSGVSASVGTRGAWLTFGRRGTRATVGLPGTGLSYSTTVPKPGDGEPVAPQDGPAQTGIPGWAWIVGLVVLAWIARRLTSP